MLKDKARKAIPVGPPTDRNRLADMVFFHPVIDQDTFGESSHLRLKQFHSVSYFNPAAIAVTAFDSDTKVAKSLKKLKGYRNTLI